MPFITLTDKFGKATSVNIDNIISYTDSGYPKDKTTMIVKGRDEPLFFQEDKGRIDQLIKQISTP